MGNYKVYARLILLVIKLLIQLEYALKLTLRPSN